MSVGDDGLERWMNSLEAQHLADLTFQEVSRALRALSSAYVERRDRLRGGAALDGAGKRAAFALFYGPLHYLTVREILRSLPAITEPITRLADLGCGTGAAGTAFARACPQRPEVVGIDCHPWAVAQAARTYGHFGLAHRTRVVDVMRAPLPKSPCAILAAFTVNELSDDGRTALLPRLIERATRGDAVLLVEPIARSVTPWWQRWAEAFVGAGGRADDWRFHVDLPPLVAKLDRAAGLNHRELTARSLWVPGSQRRPSP